MVNWLYGNSALCHLALCNLALCKLALCNLAPCNLALCNLALCHSALCHWALCNLALRNLAYCLPRAGGFQKAGDAGDVDDLWQLETAKKETARCDLARAGFSEGWRCWRRRRCCGAGLRAILQRNTQARSRHSLQASHVRLPT